MKTIIVNGAARQTGAETVEDLATELDSAPQTLLIEHNRTALHRSEWPRVVVSEGDHVEVLKVSAGG